MYLVASVFKDNNFCVYESKYTVTFFERVSQLSPFARVNEMYKDVLNTDTAAAKVSDQKRKELISCRVRKMIGDNSFSVFNTTGNSKP